MSSHLQTQACIPSVGPWLHLVQGGEGWAGPAVRGAVPSLSPDAPRAKAAPAPLLEEEAPGRLPPSSEGRRCRDSELSGIRNRASRELLTQSRSYQADGWHKGDSGSVLPSSESNRPSSSESNRPS